MSEICELTIYTSSSALQFNVVVTCDNFQDTLADALENGTVVLDTVEGSRLILNAINVIAIEVHKQKEESISPHLEK